MPKYSNDSSVVLDSCEAIANAAQTPINSMSQYMAVTLKDCALDTLAVANIVSFLCINHSRIQELILNKCKGDLGTIIAVALTNCKKLRLLSILMNSSRAAAFDQFAHSLGAGLIVTSSLWRLELGIVSFTNYFTLTSKAAKSLQEGLSKNTSLRSLQVDNCRFEERQTLRILAKGLESMTYLSDVRFRSCYEPNGQALEDHGVACLIRALENNSKLDSLDLSRNKCLDEGMIALSALLDKTPMRSLNLSCQQMDENEFLNTFHLVGALGRTSKLLLLILRSNHLSTDYDMANLAAALTHNTSVRCLDLTGNNIRSSAVTILASRIPSMKVLETLVLGWNNGFDDETSLNLAKAMKENLVIKDILCDPNLADNKEIEYYTDLNWGGRRYIDQRNKDDDTIDDRIPPIPQPVWPTILSRVSRRSEDNERRANLIYYYLQKGSAIFPV